MGRCPKIFRLCVVKSPTLHFEFWFAVAISACAFGCRMYIEQYSDDESKHGLDAQEALKPIIDLALELSKLKELTGREKPTVIT